MKPGRTQPADHSRPVVVFAHGLTARLRSLTDVPLLSMRPEEQRWALATIAEGEAQLAALKLRLLAHAEESGATTEAGAGSAADWLAVETRQVRRDTNLDTGRLLCPHHHRRIHDPRYQATRLPGGMISFRRGE